MLGLTFLGDVPYDTKIEATIGEKDVLLETTFAKKVQEITAKIERS
jgi:hypothetical protein